MINNRMRNYDYYTFGELDAYGQRQLSADSQGSVKMAISITSQKVQDNIMYKDCQYIGLTLNKEINDTYVIDYNGERLNVLYINDQGRFRQVFMSRMV